MEKTPARPLFSIHSRMFILGIGLGWTLAAIGEGVPFSKGTVFAAVFGGLIGFAIGDVVHVMRKRRKPPAAPPLNPPAPNSEAPP